MPEAEEWQRQVEVRFRFLADFGYELRAVDDSSFWETVAVYASRTNAVLIKSSVEFGRVEVELVRLDDDGEIPPVDVWVGPDSDGHALLDNVVQVRAPKQLPRRLLRGTTGKRADRALAVWARMLRDVAPDFLAGSNACIDEAHAMVLERVRRHPQVLTIHLPSSVSDEEEAFAVADARAVTPETVAIKVHRYRHSPPRRVLGRYSPFRTAGRR